MQGIGHITVKSSLCLYAINGEVLFLDIRTPHVPDNAQNGSQSSKWAYFPERRIFMTGLNGAFLCTLFRISGY
jgi:hypothetical protein